MSMLAPEQLSGGEAARMRAAWHACMQVRRLFEAFNEPFRKELRQAAAQQPPSGAAGAAGAAARPAGSAASALAPSGSAAARPAAPGGGATLPAPANKLPGADLDQGQGQGPRAGVHGQPADADSAAAGAPAATAAGHGAVSNGLQDGVREEPAQVSQRGGQAASVGDAEDGGGDEVCDALAAAEAGSRDALHARAPGAQDSWAWVLTQRMLPADDFDDEGDEEGVVDV